MVKQETGRVKWFSRTKGYGFIVRNLGGDIFMHHKDISGAGSLSLEQGNQVRFTIIETNKGFQAKDVTVLS